MAKKAQRLLPFGEESWVRLWSVPVSLVPLPKRTSDTDPIHVDWLDGLRLSGQIGLTFAPGKIGSAAFGGAWDRDLDKDLDRLAREYRVDVLICLVEYWELANWQIEALFTKCGDRGITPYWEPVVDMMAPTNKQADRVVKIALAAAQGKRVVIHCRGGRGRAGTLGACCYVVQGYGPMTSIELTRLCRPGTVETMEQEGFVVRYAKRLRHVR